MFPVRCVCKPIVCSILNIIAKCGFSFEQYRLSLHSTPLTEINHQSFVPANVKQAYRELIRRWQGMENYARQGDYASYRQEVTSYVDQVDRFVNTLQTFAEKKLNMCGIRLFFVQCY